MKDKLAWRNYSWKTKDGRDVRIKDMTDSHIQNTIKFILRKFDKALIKEMALSSDENAKYIGRAVVYMEREIRFREKLRTQQSRFFPYPPDADLI